MGRSFTVKTVHKNMYPATYNFKDEVDGTTGTDIAFVDSATLYNGACEIVSDWQSHRKVLRVTDDITPGEDPTIIHVETQATAGTREFLVGTNDVTENWEFYLYEAGLDYIVRLRIIDSALDYRDSVDAWQEIQAVVNDTWYHIKLVWRADNTFDVYVEGILQVDNQATNNNQASGVDRFYIKCWGDSIKYFYLDAYGDPDNDANYNVGDNIHWRHYKESTDSFEGDDVGTQGTSITWVDAVDTTASFEIVQEFNEHKKILRGYYSSAAGGYDYCYHTFASQAKIGWFESWIKTSDATIDNTIGLYDDTTSIIAFHIFGDKFQIHTAGAWRDVTNAPVPVDDTWYHIYIQWYDAATDTFDLWIDNIQYEDGTNCQANQTSGINRCSLICFSATQYLYLDAPISSLDSDKRADNRTFEYNNTYTKTDVTTDILNVPDYNNKIYSWRTATIHAKSSYEFSEVFFEIYDINSVLAMRGDIKNRRQEGTLYKYPLRDMNWDDLNEPITHAFTADDIHDPADSTSMLKTALPNVGQEDGDLILANADAKTDTYSPTLKYYPTGNFLRDLSDLGDSVTIIEANGRVTFDDDLASGDSLDVDTAVDKDKMTKEPTVTDILETINYFEIFGAIDPDTGDRFSKVIDNSGTDKKRKWRYVNNELRSQADVDAYAAALEIRITTVKIITFTVQDMGVHNMGTTLNYKYIKGSINIPQANYYIISEIINFDGNIATITLSEGLIESSKYSYSFERPQNYVDSYAGEIYDTDINTVSLYINPYLADHSDHGIYCTTNQGIIAHFRINDRVDPTRAITITFTFTSSIVGGTTIDGTLYIDRYVSDGSADKTNIENALNFDFTTTATYGYIDITYTLSASDIVADTLILIRWMNVDASPAIVSDVQIIYHIKRVA